VHTLLSKDGIDLGARGSWPAGTYLCEDLSAADYLQFAKRGTTQLRYMERNTRPFDEKENWNGKKILIMRPGGYGDLLFLTPSIHEIKERWPTAEVHVCVYSRFQDILFSNKEVDKIVGYPLSMDEAEQYHAWIFLENVIEGNPEAEKIHAVDIVAQRVGLSKLRSKEMRYNLTPEEVEWGLFTYPRVNTKRRVAIQVEASGKARTYPGNLMTEVIIRLAQKDIEVFLLGDPYRVKAKSTPLVRNLMIEGLSFRNSVAAMRTCDVVLGPDSVMIHLAGALHMPALGLYAAFPWQLRTAYAPTVTAIQGNGGCDLAPCFYHGSPRAPHFPFDGPCNRSQRCEPMANIAPDRIIANLERMLSTL
jgi:ADP-heptose:LPS heptosyltransferase